ncbi:hypothetical protein EDB81DRAFT_697352 [Dactylonectria macrodidyma]|uniref:Uncharacterized protein n=1 Tax=Dactylonectria macrodidyma TaxID=307937 RepID=A0A9P9E0M6_9HYPO|nr:hypothetical protein EDB81DRAFT_697352 [Dactylonectria macrodidyma]
MAAPPTKTTQDLNGKWVVNKDLSDSPDPVLSLQGISYLTRKAICMSTITVELEQFTAPPPPPSTSTDPAIHLNQTQSTSLTATKEERCLDNETRDHSDWIFGAVKGNSRYVSLDEIEDEYLKKDWLIEGEGKTLIFSYAVSQGNGWDATQVWGFQTVNGERRYCRRVLATKGKKRATVFFVYDYAS